MTVCPGIVTYNRKETDECQKIEKKTETQNKTSQRQKILTVPERTTDTKKSVLCADVRRARQEK